MKTINLRDLYPDVYKTDTFVEVTEEVLDVIQTAQRLMSAVCTDTRPTIPWTAEMVLRKPLCSARQPRRTSLRKNSSRSRSMLL